MSVFLIAKILGGIAFVLILIKTLFFNTEKKKEDKYLIYTLLLIIISVNISIWVIAATNS
ncbi:hypothetical protein ACH0B5_17845 [Ureibacillus sp. 179-F W5.1 NHS]|uniref:Uncharacterized protein n=2 Tax=Bacillales TaxID=1385 RepID=A0A3M8H019_9BACI|nr:MULTISPECIES: hypothetical protein [Bacillales]MBD8027591.1 hypothetical protein [Ureibacillus galli]RNC95384.1 hypothetical protein EC501_18160 [Lysinibacillus halotolerans]